MFQFPPFAACCYWIHNKLIQGSRDQFAFDQSPGLIAVFHALHRLLVPRHPPHALSSLAALTWPPPPGQPDRRALPTSPRGKAIE